MNKNNYIGKVIEYCMLIVHFRLSIVLKGFLLVLTLTALNQINVKAAGNHIGDEDNTTMVYDEIPVRVMVEGYKNFFVDAIYTNNKLLYVNIEDLFRMLEIPCVAGQKGNSLSGFIEEESRTYLIDYDLKQVVIDARTIAAKNRLVKESGQLYLEVSLFNEAFGLQLNFNFRSLAIQLKSDFELPVIKQSRIEKMRSNLSKIQGETIADTVLKRNYHLFKAGTIDWLASSTQTWIGQPDNRLRLGIGTELLYGEADVSVDYYNQLKFDNRWVQYLWRWVDNDKKIIKQAQAGKISNQTISFINAPVVGAVIRNSPTTVRKATGYYTISEITEPNWTVELYINNVLVDYTQADASGSYTFKVPIVYGYTTLKLKFYGPQGEERTEERTMNVPYTVMPVNEFEYGISAGVVQDGSHSRFGRADFNYGVSHLLTVGGGFEYLSSITTGAYIPFAKATFQPFSSLTLNAEYAYGVRTHALLNYSFGKNAVLEIDYAKYVDGQKATIFNANEERKIRLSLPFRYKKMNGFFKLDYSQMIYSEFYYNQGNAMVSMYYNQFSANSSLQMNWIGQKTPYIINETSLSYRMSSGFTLRPSARYNISENSILSCKAEIEKRISKAYLLLSYEQYFTLKDHYVNLTFRYDLPFARASASVTQSKKKVMTSQSAQGSLAFGGDKYTHVSNNSSVSKGGILVYPFLDLNQNGIFDKGEPMVKLNTIKLSGGRAIFNEKDSIVRIPDLNAFTNYILEFKDSDLETMSWRFKNKIYSILVDPNQFKRVDIPIISVGEASGMTYIEKNTELKGLGRIIIKFYEKSSNMEVAQSLSESDGYVYYLGLEPGNYVACVDSVQLANLGLIVDPPCREFTIKESKDGDIVGGLDFILHPAEDKLLQSQNSIEERGIVSPVNADSLALLNVTPGKLSEQEEVVSPVIETIAQLTDTTSLPVRINPSEIAMVEKLVAQETVSVSPMTDTTSLPVKIDPAELVAIEKLVAPETESVSPMTDTTSLTVRINPSEIAVVEKPVTQETENMSPMTDTISLPAKINPAELAMVEKLLTPDAESVSPMTDTTSLPVKINPAELAVVEKLVPQKTESVSPMSDTTSLPVKINPAELEMVEKLVPQKTESVSPTSDTTSLPVKINPAEIAVVEKLVAQKTVSVSHPYDNIGLPVKTIPENAVKGKSVIVQDSVIIMPATMHRIDQQGADSKISKDFTPGDTLFKVQLLALPRPLKDKNYFTELLADVPGLTIVETFEADGFYHYSTGALKSLSDARKLMKVVKRSGWKECFIPIYIRGVRSEMTFHHRSKLKTNPPQLNVILPPVKAEERSIVTQEQGSTKPKALIDIPDLITKTIAEPEPEVHIEKRVVEMPVVPKYLYSDTLFKIQLLKLQTLINSEVYFGLLYYKMPGIKIEVTQGEDGIYIFSTGVFKSQEEARKYEAIIRNSGWVDSFITTYFVASKSK